MPDGYFLIKAKNSFPLLSSCKVLKHWTADMLVNDRNYSEDKKNKRLQYGSKQYKNLREYEKQD